jgi:hypothetical protein
MKGAARKLGQNRKKVVRSPRFNIPAPQIARIRLRHIAGQSNREIAFAERRCKDTVAKIVNAADFGGYITKMQEEMYGLAPEALLSLRVALQLDSSGRLSYDFLKDIGVIPVRRNMSVAQGQESALSITEDEAVMREAIKLGYLTMNQAKIFNQQLPNLDEVELDETEFETLNKLNHRG